MRNIFRDSFFFTYNLMAFWVCCCSDAAFAEYLLASDDFWDDRSSYSAIFCSESGPLAWSSPVISTGFSLLNLSNFCFMVSDFAWTNRQICITKVNELHEPCFKYRNSFLALLCLWCAVCSQFLLFKSLWAVRDILLRSISSKLRVLFFIGRIEPIFPKTLRRVYDLAFSNFAQMLVEKKFDFLEGYVPFVSPNFTVSLEILMFVQKLKGHQSIQRRAVVFLPKHFSASFGWKKKRLLSFLSKQIPH